MSECSLASSPWSKYLLLALLATITTGCASPHERVEAILEPTPPSFGTPLVEQLPLRIRYVFGPSVTETLYQTETGPGGQRRRLQLGPASQAAFGRVFSALFVDARPVADVPPGQELPEQIDGIVWVEVTDVLAFADASVTYELTFLNPDGTEEGRWRVIGVGKTDYSGQHGVELAIRMAAAKVARDLDQQFAIRAWLERNRSSDSHPSEDG